MSKINLLAAAATLFAVASPAHAANLVKNGSFENGFTDWNTTASTGETAPVVIAYNQASPYPTGAFGEAVPTSNAVGSASPDAVGDFTAYFSSDFGSDRLLQTVNLTAGKFYRVGFDYYAPENGINNPSDALLTFLIDDIPQVSFQAGGASVPAKTWLNFDTVIKATATGPFTFQFKGLGTTAAADFAIDRVYALGAPEPSTWAMMILGFGFAGAALRRRQTASVRFA
jgi:hypothetical protein